MSNIPRTCYYRQKMSPCKDCQKRFVGCHSSCNDYAEWKTEEYGERDKVYKEFFEQHPIEDYKIKLRINLNRKKRRKKR